MLSTVLCISKQMLNIVKIKNNRTFFHWLVIAFNSVDKDRIKQLGPDRVCAEWLLRNGAAVLWKGHNEYLTDYNSLPKETLTLHIQAVDATGSAIHHVGFLHFEGCKYIKEMKLVQCGYIENDAMTLLKHVKNTLTSLEVIDCKNVSDKGLLELKILTNLKTLKVGKLPYIKDQQHVVAELTAALPNCEITYTQ